jgi:hypothetical protein
MVGSPSYWGPGSLPRPPEEGVMVGSPNGI